jgi:hypothetical protein
VVGTVGRQAVIINARRAMAAIRWKSLVEFILLPLLSRIISVCNGFAGTGGHFNRSLRDITIIISEKFPERGSSP